MNQLIRDYDGGFIMVGSASSTLPQHLDKRTYVVKTDVDGNVIWERYYDFFANRSITLTTDMSYIIIGMLNIAKLNLNGDTIWLKDYSSYWGSTSRSFLLDDGHILITTGIAINNVRAVKINDDGDVIWVNEVLSENRAIISDNNSFTFGDIEVIQFENWSNDNDLQLQQTTPYVFAVPQRLIKLNNSGYVAMGRAGDIGLVRFNNAGDTLWTRNHDLPTRPLGTDVKETNSGGLVIAGIYEQFGNINPLFLTTDNDGHIEDVFNYFDGTSRDFWNDMLLECDSTMVAGGYTWTLPLPGDRNFTLTKVKLPNQNCIQVGLDELPEVGFQLYPNPAGEAFTIQFEQPMAGELEIYNLLGQQVKHQPIRGQQEAIIHTSHLTPGLYLLRWHDLSGKYYSLGKVVKQ